jgi:hypothetical protein
MYFYPPAISLERRKTSTLKMDAICSSETLVSICKSTLRYYPEDRHRHNRISVAATGCFFCYCCIVPCRKSICHIYHGDKCSLVSASWILPWISVVLRLVAARWYYQAFGWNQSLASKPAEQWPVVSHKTCGLSLPLSPASRTSWLGNLEHFNTARAPGHLSTCCFTDRLITSILIIVQYIITLLTSNSANQLNLSLYRIV